MKILETPLKDAYVLEPKVFGDSRGWFTESWSSRTMGQLGFHYNFVQDNHSYSAEKGTLRGLHYQYGAAAQAKLVRCIRGAVADYAVDLRKGSPTYLQWARVELSADNKLQFLIPRGFAHAFLTLTDEVEFLYKADNGYAPQWDRSIRWNDPDIGIAWDIEAPRLSGKDENAPLFRSCDADFVYNEAAIYNEAAK
jgi:dTDP-4-dehydrorhamnose 3,5-epimerase